MLKIYWKYIAFAIVFILVLVPSLNVPMLSDDYYYYYVIGPSLPTQIQHYMAWSGRLITNIISGYMMNWLPHYIYEGLTALALSLMIFFYASIPSAIENKKIEPHWVSIIILFIFYWIANPALGETSFWFVGAANYVWPSFFVSLYLVMLIKTKENKSILSSIGCFIIGFLGGCSNENTSIIVLALTIIYIIYNNNLKYTYPYLLGVIAGCATLIFSPGGAARSKFFVGWHQLSLIGKVDEQLFTRMPEIMKSYWVIYVLIIILALTASLLKVSNKRAIVYATIFFIAAIAANLAFVAAPYMPPRAGNGALCLTLISVAFLINAIMNDTGKLYKVVSIGFVALCGLMYFIPSYVMFTYALSRTWQQENIRKEMIMSQLDSGSKDIVIPDHYFTRLIKNGDGYPTYKHPAIKEYYKVNSFSEVPVNFDYSSLSNQRYIPAGLKLLDGLNLQGIYFYKEPFSEKKLIIYKVDNDINNAFNKSVVIFSHLEVLNEKGDALININKDTALPAINISGSWYTFSDAQDVDFDKIKKINIGMYSINPFELKSNHSLLVN